MQAMIIFTSVLRREAYFSISVCFLHLLAGLKSSLSPYAANECQSGLRCWWVWKKKCLFLFLDKNAHCERRVKMQISFNRKSTASMCLSESAKMRLLIFRQFLWFLRFPCHLFSFRMRDTEGRNEWRKCMTNVKKREEILCSVEICHTLTPFLADSLGYFPSWLSTCS